MQFEYTEPQDEIERLFGGFFHINAYGPIKLGDDQRFNQFLERTAPPPRTTVYINSGGGDVETAIKMGQVIRNSWFETSIGTYLLDHSTNRKVMVARVLKPGKCLSAATLLYIAGRLRHFPKGALFAVHRFSYKDPLPENWEQSQVLSAAIGRYVVGMGILPEFLEDSASVPSSKIQYMALDRLKELKVATGGATDVTWSTESRNQMLYVKGERDSIFGHHKVMLCYNRGAGFLFWAVIETLGRERELTTHGLVEIVLNGEEERIHISDRCERQVHGIYVNILCQISPEEARRIAYSESFGVQIRFASTSAVFLGISAMETDDGKDQLVSFFETLTD